jgi:hypothetical protein
VDQGSLPNHIESDMRTFVEGDREIVGFVAEFRLVTIEHLERLTGRKTIWRRLPVLVQLKQVFKKERGINQKHVYACSPVHKRSLFTIDHELMITDIHVAFHQTGTLVYWEQGKDCWKGNVHQDAFCTLQHPHRKDANRIDYFIEADTGTQNHRDIATKIQTYLDYMSVQPNPFRVLFATISNVRAENLAKLAQIVVPHEKRRAFLFTTIEHLKNDCLGRICSVPYSRDSVSILPGLSVA